jgi:hypothetical protein
MLPAIGFEPFSDVQLAAGFRPQQAWFGEHAGRENAGRTEDLHIGDNQNVVAGSIPEQGPERAWYSQELSCAVQAHGRRNAHDVNSGQHLFSRMVRLDATRYDQQGHTTAGEAFTQHQDLGGGAVHYWIEVLHQDAETRPTQKRWVDVPYCSREARASAHCER